MNIWLLAGIIGMGASAFLYPTKEIVDISKNWRKVLKVTSLVNGVMAAVILYLDFDMAYGHNISYSTYIPIVYLVVLTVYVLIVLWVAFDSRVK